MTHPSQRDSSREKAIAKGSMEKLDIIRNRFLFLIPVY